MRTLKGHTSSFLLFFWIVSISKYRELTGMSDQTRYTPCEFVTKAKKPCSRGIDGKPADCDAKYVSCINLVMISDTGVINRAVLDVFIL